MHIIYLNNFNSNNTWLLTITGCGATVVRVGAAVLTAFPAIFNGSIIGDGPMAGWGAGSFTSCFSALFLWRGGGSGLLSLWSFAVGTYKKDKISTFMGQIVFTCQQILYATYWRTWKQNKYSNNHNTYWFIYILSNINHWPILQYYFY